MAHSDCKMFAHNAMEDLSLDVFENVMGRYVHGANFLLMPLKFFLNCPIDQHYTRETPQTPLLDCLLGLLAPSPYRDGLPVEDWRAWARNPTARGLWDREFRTFMRRVRETACAKQLDALVIGATRNFLTPHCFPTGRGDRFDAEFVGYKCMGGRAYVFTDIRNRAYGMHEESEGLFSRSIIIDCGLNKYERGRLIQTLTEFSAERVVSLLWLGRFRLVHHALNVVQTRLSLALSYFHSDTPQTEETLPSGYTSKVELIGPPRGEEGLLGALEFLSSCLSVLNDVVEGGIMDRANASGHSFGAISGKLNSIREEALPGFQSLSEFLERRYARPIRTASRVGERYEMLRRRITEIAELTSVRMQARQSNDQDAGIKIGLLITGIALAVAIISAVGPAIEFLKGILGEPNLGPSYYYAVVAASVVACVASLLFIAYVGSRLLRPGPKRRRRAFLSRK